MEPVDPVGEGIVAYRVYFSNGVFIGEVGVGTTTFKSTGLGSGTTYNYYVRSRTIANRSNPSNTAGATTESPVPVEFWETESADSWDTENAGVWEL